MQARERLHDALPAYVAGLNATGTNYYIIDVDSAGAALVRISDNALRDNGKIDIAGFDVTIPGGASIETGQVAINGPGQPIVAARTNRAFVQLVLHAAVALYLGKTGVTVATGLFIPGVAGASIKLDTAAALYGATASALTVSYMEVF